MKNNELVIKPLEWVDKSELISEAHTPIISYTVYKWKDSWNWYFVRAGCEDDYQMDMACENLKDGKQKAWNHHVDYISSTLDTSVIKELKDKIDYL